MLLQSDMRLKIVQLYLSLLTCLLTITSVKAGEPVRNNAGNAPFIYSGNIFMLNTDFTSQQSLAKTDINSVFQPYLSEGFSFYSRSNLDFSVQGGIAFNSDTSFTEITRDLLLCGGYTLIVNPSLAFRPSYTHLEYSGNSNTYYTMISDMLQLDVYFQKANYYSALFSSLLFGEKFQVYSTWKNGIGLYSNRSASKNIMPGIAFELDISFSDRNYYNEVVYRSWDEETLQEWVDMYYQEYSRILSSAISVDEFATAKTNILGRLKTEHPELFEPAYTLSTLNLSVPLSLSGKKTYFYVTPILMVPLSSVIFYEQQIQFILNAGFSFSFR